MLNPNFEDEILAVLGEAGVKGMPLRRVALNVYNMRTTLFSSMEQESVYTAVATYLRTVSKQSGSPIMRGERRGWYRLNPASPKMIQKKLEFQFSDAD